MKHVAFMSYKQFGTGDVDSQCINRIWIVHQRNKSFQ